MKRLATIATTALLALPFLAARPAAAQSTLPISIEPRFGVGVPVGGFADELNLGVGLGGDVILNLTPQVGVYGGYSFMSFNLKKSLFGNDPGSYDVQGLDAGLRLGLPMPGLSPYARGGVAYYKGEVKGLGGGEQKLGFQGGVGLEYTLGARATLTPEVSYVKIPVDIGDDIQFVRADFGIRFRL